MDNKAKQTKVTTEQDVFNSLRVVFFGLQDLKPSRELSLVKTKLEEAMMWLNKDRAIKDELKSSETHVQ